MRGYLRLESTYGSPSQDIGRRKFRVERAANGIIKDALMVFICDTKWVGRHYWRRAQHASINHLEDSRSSQTPRRTRGPCRLGYIDSVGSRGSPRRK